MSPSSRPTASSLWTGRSCTWKASGKRASTPSSGTRDYAGRVAPFVALWEEEKERLEAGARRPATEEGPAAQALAAARAQSSAILMARMQTDLVQTGAFAASEFATFAQAGLFTTWAAGQTYARGYRLVHRGIVYEVLQDVTALADQPPDAAGMPAVYRPLSVAPESGDGQADSPGQAASSRDRSATSSIAEASCA